MLVAIALLVVCAAPAADAVRNAAATPAASAQQLRNLLCLKSRIEAVSAEPYQNLLLAAAGNLTPSTSYSQSASGQCPAINVYLAVVSVDLEGNPSYPPADTGLLQLVVTTADETLVSAPAGPPTPPGPGPTPPSPPADPLAPGSQPGVLASMSLATMLVR